MLVLIITGITFIYVLLIASFIYGFEKVRPFKLTNLAPKTRFTVVIPFRNEADQLPQLLTSIQSLQYPKHLFEIIFVDDDSDDDSVELIKGFLANARNDIKVISNERTTNSPKKDAITKAVQQANYNWIITTDADCIIPKYWLDGYDAFIQQTNLKCVAGPITYNAPNSFLNRFQTLDFLSLQGATIGGFGIQKPFLCNGANFAYTKEAFNSVNGFNGNTQIASGDDIFLLEKMAKHYPKDIRFLKCENAIVSTNPERSWKDLFEQRIRWASKTSSYNNWFGKLTGFIVLLMNSVVVFCILFSAFGIIKATVLFYVLFIKFNIDVLLIYKAATFYNQKAAIKSYLFGFLLYPFFSVYIALISLFKEYKWKDRTYKR